MGNDIYNTEPEDNALSERLGPPVQQNTDDLFEEERRYYSERSEDGVKRDEKWSRDSLDRRYDSSHGRSDSRGRDRGREGSRDRGRDRSRDRRDPHGSYRGHRGDRGDYRRGGSRDYYDRREGSRERHRSDSYSSHYDRREGSQDKDYRDYYNKGDHTKKYDERFSTERMEPQYGDRVRRDSDTYDGLSRERSSERPGSPGSYYRRSLESLTQPVMRSPPKAEPTPPTAKPLKSILKKKTNNVAPPVIPPAEGEVDPYRSHIENRLGLALGHEFNSGRPPMGQAMDIEDEEKFLYGEPEKRAPSPPSSKAPLWTQAFTGGQFQPPGIGGPLGNTFPILGQQKPYSSPSAYIQEKPPSEPEPERQYDSSDLLSIFTKRPQPRVIEEAPPLPTLPPSGPAEALQQEAKQQKYDPTIENILKSIGFDFEMSKRMQEKAGSDVPKEEVPQQYGINQTASFLGGGLSTEDLTANLFSKKRPAGEVSSSREGRERDREPTEVRQSFLDQILSRDILNKRSSQPPPSNPPPAPLVSQEFTPKPDTPYSLSFPPFSGGYTAPDYTSSYASSLPPAVDPYSYPPEYSTAPSQYPPTTAYSAVETPHDSKNQFSPGIPKAPEKFTRENLTSIPLEDNLPKMQKPEPSKKKNARPNLREIPKSSEVIKPVSENTIPSHRTVLPPKSESVQFPKQTGKRPAERESPQSLNPVKQAERAQRDKGERQKRIQALEEELTKLRRQQNEIMRKKRRQKDGHKDPILLQNSQLQEEIALQIAKLRKIGEGRSLEELQPQQKKSKVEEREESVPERVEVKSEAIVSPGPQITMEEAMVKEEVKSEPVVKSEDKPKQVIYQEVDEIPGSCFKLLNIHI